MKFGELNQKPCALPEMVDGSDCTQTPGDTGPALDCSDADYRVSHPGDCPNDPACSDPAFAAAHPELCLTTARLILKPGVATVEAHKSVQFRAYLWRDGQETEVTATFSVGNTGIAVIGGVSGNATGVTAGITTVVATYGTFTAMAQLEVVATCAARTNFFALIMDVSKSMSAAFSETGGTRLAFAKTVASQFIDCVTEKDRYGVWSFDSNAAQAINFNFSRASTKQAINALRTTASTNTNIAAGLQAAKDAFDANLIDDANRIYVLFTDGENKSGVNPVALANEIKESGAILIVVGLRAYSTWFQQLEHIASGGFFLNATKRNEALIADILNGLKAMFCSGKCTPSEAFSGTLPELNYTAFAKWSVVSGTVDLIGQGSAATMFDFIPGNGMYVDLCGSTGGADDLGLIESVALSLTEGETYTLRYKLAGNQRELRDDDVVRVTMLVDGSEITNQEHLVSSYDGFEEFTLQFSGQLGTIHAIRVQQRSIGDGGTSVFGCLLDSVSLVKDSDGTVVFEDSFDNENLTYFPRVCGDSSFTEDGTVNVNCDNPMVSCVESPAGTWVFNGYDCATGCGCATDTTPAQIPDESPLLDMEGGPVVYPTIYTSTRSATVSCAEGLSGSDVTKSATATSEISQADADTKAYQLAYDAAAAAMVCQSPFEIGDILNIRLWPNAPIEGVSQSQVDADRKQGYAAFGNSPDDFWNQSGNEAFDPSQSGIHCPLYKADGNLCGITLRNITNTPIVFERINHADPVMRWFGRLTEDGTNYRYKITGLPEGTYTLAVFGRGGASGENGKFWAQTESGDYTVETLVDTYDWKDPILTGGVHYALYTNILVLSGEGIYLHALANASDLSLLGAIQIKRTS